MGLIFWDTSLFIYLMEDHPKFGARVAHVRQRMLDRKDRLCTSALTLGELLAGPHSRSNEALANQYKTALVPPHVEVLPFTRELADHYARIRCDRAIPPADAVQLACATQARVDLFLTNDRRLKTKLVPGIQFIADLETDLL